MLNNLLLNHAIYQCKFASFSNFFHNFTLKIDDQVAWPSKHGMPVVLGGSSLCTRSSVNFCVFNKKLFHSLVSKASK